MKKLSIMRWRGLATAQLSGRVFYIVVAVAAVLFALFRLVGYDTPYDDNPDYNAPLLTGALITFMLLLTAATLALMVWGMVRGIRMSGDANRVVNNIPARRISMGVAAGFAVVMLVCFALSDTTPLTINGRPYADAVWLRVAGMFVGASVLMVAAAVAAVLYGATRYIRK